ncbi:GAF domain-containing protein [Dactylosporangium matsuzakiense]|uniref:GAF domain-containing protein n=1 Tax=Dactylosporangium matsuzakiense TaxID=53360 RepID=A0A9W6KJU8_9ACTN|nr:GAF domain-containing protein [Dactylosporangium matsuzakiense]GLL02843.1 hypothetical protein GCM10017581_045850 [Dactylosporangium matsuzakiense]
MAQDMRIDMLDRLRMVMHALSGSPDESDTPELLVSQAVAAVGASGGVLGVVRDHLWIDVLTSRGYTSERVAAFNPLMVGSQFPLTDAVRTGEPVWLPTMEGVAARYPAFAERTRSEALAALPLLIGAETIGVLGITFDDGPHHFSSVEQSFLLTIADICASVLDRWRMGSAAVALRLPCARDLCNERAFRTRQAEGFALLAGRLGIARTTGEFSSAAIEHLPAVLDATAAFVGLIDDSADVMIVRVTSTADAGVLHRNGRRLLSDSLPWTDAARTNQAVYLSNSFERQRRYPRTEADAAALGAEAMAAVPLRNQRGRAIGAIGIVWPDPIEFGPALRSRLGHVADLRGKNAERALSFDRAHAAVSTIRERSAIALPSIAGLDVHAMRWTDSPDLLGCDFSAGLRLSDDRIGVIIGQVLGGAGGSAGDAAYLSTLLVAAMAQAVALESVADRALSLLKASETGPLTATVALAVIDTTERSLSYLNLGHPPLLVRRRNTNRTKILTDARYPLFGLPTGNVSAGQTSFDRDDVLVAYTIGLIEHATDSVDASVAQTAAALGTMHGSARQIAHALMGRRRAAGTMPRDATVTVIVGRSDPAGAAADGTPTIPV